MDQCCLVPSQFILQVLCTPLTLIGWFSLSFVMKRGRAQTGSSHLVQQRSSETYPDWSISKNPPYSNFRRAVSSVVIDLLFSLYVQGQFSYVWFFYLPRLVINNFGYNSSHNVQPREMEENEEFSGSTTENKRHKLRRVSSRTSTTSMISAAEPSPQTLRRNSSKKHVATKR